MKPKLRVGVFADSPLQPRWIVEALEKVAASDFAEVVAVAAGGAASRVVPWLWRAYLSVDRWIFGSQPDPSVRIPLLPGLAALPLDRAALAPLRLDVAFALGEVDCAALEGVAKHGVWRYCFGEERSPVEALAGVREVTDGAPVTASALAVRRGGGADERLAYQSWSRTFQYSVARNRDRLLRKTAEFAGRALRELHRSGDAWLGRCAPLTRASAPRAERLPGGAELVRGLSGLGRRITRRALQKLLTIEQWFLAYRFGGGERWQGDLRPFTLLMPPRDRYWADPFPLERGGRHYIFFEEYLFATGKAHIAVIEVSRGGERSEPRRVLERDHHVAYPFLIEHDGELYMAPDSGANRSVELYRCVEFPHRWRLEKVLLRGAWFVDATLHRAEDRWWMFVNVGLDGAEAHDELHLYHADRLFGEWQPHARNPVKSDVRCSRPAGRLFQRDGALYRPAQICAPLYGSGVSINRVLHLSPGAYLEQEEERVLPTHPAGLLGIHTLNRAGELSVLDGFTRRRRH